MVVRTVRYRAPSAKLPGQCWEFSHEPSNFLVDMLNQQIQEGLIRYIICPESSSRLDALSGLEKLNEFKTYALGRLVETSTDLGPRSDITSDLLLLQALQRRGAAYELANVMEWQTLELLVRLLLSVYQRPQVPGYGAISLSQLERAAREVFTYFSMNTRDGLHGDAAGVRLSTASCRWPSSSLPLGYCCSCCPPAPG